MLLSVVCMLMLAHAMVPDVTAQLPPYGRPWTSYFPENRENNATNVVSASSTVNPLGERINSVPAGTTFRIFNNVPIQGPEDPCIGCIYRLTSSGFVKV